MSNFFTKVSALGDLSQELFWKVTNKPHIGLESLSWSLCPNLLQQTSLIWPRSYRWPKARKWLASLVAGFQSHVEVNSEDIQQPTDQKLEHVVLFELKISGERFVAAVDYSDYSEADLEIASKVLLYFKMQYQKDTTYPDNVLPGGFVPNDQSLYNVLPALRRIQSNKYPLYDVYGRFSLEFASDIRRKAIELLSKQKHFIFEGGALRMRYSRFLKETSRASVCINLPEMAISVFA